VPTDQSLAESGTVESSISGSVAHVRWSRTWKRNAFDSVLASRLAEVLESLAQRQDLSVVVLRSEGPIFCAGWDLDEIKRVDAPEQAAALIASGRRCLDAIDRLPQVVVSVVERSTIGFGVAVVAHSDVVLVADSVQIKLPELQHGLVPASVLGDLVAKVGRARALRWCLIGEVPLDEALSSGLVSECIESSRFEDVVHVRIESIGAQVPAAVHATKRLSERLKGDLSTTYDIGDSFAISMLSPRISL
jgi:enoyl-CoA hydratase/carnithine racemase